MAYISLVLRHEPKSVLWNYDKAIKLIHFSMLDSPVAALLLMPELRFLLLSTSFQTRTQLVRDTSTCLCLCWRKSFEQSNMAGSSIVSLRRVISYAVARWLSSQLCHKTLEQNAARRLKCVESVCAGRSAGALRGRGDSTKIVY